MFDLRTARFPSTSVMALAVLSLAGCSDDALSADSAVVISEKPARKTEGSDRRPDAAFATFVPILPTSSRFAQNPELIARLVETPHGYFRFINIPFSQAICSRYADRMQAMPTVNLHGDAHVEQYTVTEFGVGLSDFDDSSFGPAVIDLLRFATSLRLAAREREWPNAFEPAVAAFLDGYRSALRSPDCDRPATPVAARARSSFAEDRSAFLEEATSQMLSVDSPRSFDAEYTRYRALMESEHPDLRPGYFELKNFGRFQVGVGSALDRKYLLRIEGPTDDASDDVILEAKQVRDISDIQCVYGTSGGGAFRILTSQSRIGEMPHRFLAQVPPDPSAPNAPMFWVHEWVANYHELRVATSLESPEELAGVARDVGIQLGRGHTRAIASPLDSQLRRAQLTLVDELESDVRETSQTLAQRTLLAWEWFRSESSQAQ